MLCPKCKTEIPEGLLYCPTCGEEIIIVSDFEIKLEDNIDTTVFADTTEIPDLLDVQSAPTEEIPGSDRNSYHTAKVGKTRRKRIVLWTLGVLAFICVAVGVFAIVKSIINYNDFNIQYELAQSLYDEGDYTKAVKKAKHAINIDETQLKAYVLSADIYCAQNNYDAAVAVLVNALDVNPGSVALYDRIIKCYEAEGDYDSAHSLLVYSNDEAIMAKYPEYFPAAPDFSLEEGAYVSPQPVVLSSAETGTIFYTTDGSEPTRDSLLYENPIPLEEGVTEISAVFFNEKGIPSKSRTYRYEVMINVPDTPSLLTKGGSYTLPNPVGVNETAGITYYYTEGSDVPTDESSVYEAPLFMPFGKSTFTFIAKNEDGIYSEPISVSYDLTMAGAFDKSVAEYAISFQLTSTGDTKIGYTYSCTSGYSSDGTSYYIVHELNGSKKTGRVFAVDAITGALYKVSYSKDSQKYVFGAI